MLKYQSIAPSIEDTPFLLGLDSCDRVDLCLPNQNTFLLSGSTGFWRQWELRGELQGEVLQIQGIGKRPQWLEPLLRGVEKVSNLEDDWDSYGGKRLELSSVIQGIIFLKELLDVDSLTPDIFVTTKGGIQFEWHTQDINLEIEITPDNRKQFYYELLASDDECEDEINGDPGKLQKVISLLRTPSK